MVGPYQCSEIGIRVWKLAPANQMGGTVGMVMRSCLCLLVAIVVGNVNAFANEAAGDFQSVWIDPGGDELGELYLEPIIDLEAGVATAKLLNFTTDGSPIYYRIQLSSVLLDSDHIIVDRPSDHPGITTRLDLTGATLAFVPLLRLTEGDDWAPFGVDEIVGVDSITYIVDDPVDWRVADLYDDDGSHRIRFTGPTCLGGGSINDFIGPDVAALTCPFDLNGDGATNKDDLQLACSDSVLNELLRELEILRGDFDGGGVVDFTDYLTLSGNFNLETTRYTDGDANCSGVVDFSDFLLMSGNFGRGAEAISVPEADDASGLFVASICLAVLGCRRRSGSGV